VTKLLSLFFRALVMGDGVPCYGALEIVGLLLLLLLSVAVCDMFSVKEWPNLENRVRVRSRSLKMAPIDRSHTSLNT